MRVESRLIVAHRGADLLDRKQRILEDELERMRLAADRQRAEWTRAAREAQRWLARAAALDGLTGIASGTPAQPARIRLNWTTMMGVPFPAEADCELPPIDPGGGSSALSFAVRAHHSATLAAVRCAAADDAVRRIGVELTNTRVRAHAVRKRWIPRLEEQQNAILRRLADQELEETLQLRWSAEHSEQAASEPPTGGGTP